MRRIEYDGLLKLSLDLHFLRGMLIPGLDLCTSNSWAKRKLDLKELASMHGAKLRICRKAADSSVATTYDDVQKQITVVSTVGDKNELSVDDILYSYTHELSHAIQYQLLHHIPVVIQTQFFSSFSHCLRLEQVAETLAYYVALNYFPSISVENALKKEHYLTYFSEPDILYVAERYGFDPLSEEVTTEVRNLSCR